MSLLAARLAALVVATGLALVTAGGTAASPGTALVDGIPQRGTVLGAASAPVTLIVYEDLACPHCRTYTLEAFPAIVREYVRTGFVKVDFRGIAAVNPRLSRPALRYALAAARQGRLWQLTQLFYENQSRLASVVTPSGVRTLARQVRGLNLARFLADAKAPATERWIDALTAEAVRRSVPGTPWFLVKRGTAAPEVVRPEAYDAESFRALLDRAIERP